MRVRHCAVDVSLWETRLSTPLAIQAHTRASQSEAVYNLFRDVENPAALLAVDDLAAAFGADGGLRRHFHVATGAEIRFCGRTCCHPEPAQRGEGSPKRLLMLHPRRRLRDPALRSG